MREEYKRKKRKRKEKWSRHRRRCDEALEGAMGWVAHAASWACFGPSLTAYRFISTSKFTLKPKLVPTTTKKSPKCLFLHQIAQINFYKTFWASN